MIVADQKKILYVHIFKTGGSSITKMLMPYITEKCRSKNPRIEGNNWQGTWHIDNRMHSKFSDCLAIINMLDIDLDEYYKFTFVRNPYSWILSVWNNFYQSPMGNASKTSLKNRLKFQLGKVMKKKFISAQKFYEMYPDGSFKNFVLFIDYIVSNEPQLVMKYWGCYDQYSFIENNCNIQFDLIGKFESFEENLQTITKIVEGNNAFSVPHITHGSNYNKRERENYLQYYDEESIQIINNVFARDFEAFGYQTISNIA